MWEIQNQFTFLVLLRFFLCLCQQTISMCQHYNRAISRNNAKKHFQWWVLRSKTGKDIVSLLYIRSALNLMLFHKHASMHRRKWTQHCKSQDCGGGADRGETQFGLRHWVVHQNTSSLSISTCCSRHNQENKGKIILLLPDPLSLFLVSYCLSGGKSKLRLREKYLVFLRPSTETYEQNGISQTHHNYLGNLLEI